MVTEGHETCIEHSASKKSHLLHSFSCPPNATTVRMELKTSSATDPALAYASNSLLDTPDIICVEQLTKPTKMHYYKQQPHMGCPH